VIEPLALGAQRHPFQLYLDDFSFFHNEMILSVSWPFQDLIFVKQGQHLTLYSRSDLALRIEAQTPQRHLLFVDNTQVPISITLPSTEYTLTLGSHYHSLNTMPSYFLS